MQRSKRRKSGRPETHVYAITQLHDPNSRPVILRSELRRMFANSRDVQVRSVG